MEKNNNPRCLEKPEVYKSIFGDNKRCNELFSPKPYCWPCTQPNCGCGHCYHIEKEGAGLEDMSNEMYKLITNLARKDKKYLRSKMAV